jgi:hypothetical protein
MHQGLRDKHVLDQAAAVGYDSGTGGALHRGPDLGALAHVQGLVWDKVFDR